ncbi:hypothetical protein ACOMHN_049005 [Nucella lapillus]
MTEMVVSPSETDTIHAAHVRRRSAVTRNERNDDTGARRGSEVGKPGLSPSPWCRDHSPAGARPQSKNTQVGCLPSLTGALCPINRFPHQQAPSAPINRHPVPPSTGAQCPINRCPVPPLTGAQCPDQQVPSAPINRCPVPHQQAPSAPSTGTQCPHQQVPKSTGAQYPHQQVPRVQSTGAPINRCPHQQVPSAPSTGAQV